MMRKIYVCLTLLLFVFIAQSQSVPSEILKWKNGADGAFSLTHDDFGLPQANGIENYVDTMCYNRGLTMAFGALVNSCSNPDWLNARNMVAHGHEIMNHSYSHKCGNPDAGDWCVAYGVWDENDFDLELDFASRKIEANVGPYPRFFIYPFDQFIPEMNEFLEDSLNYLGTRTGTYDFGPNAYNLATPFEPAFWVTAPGYSIDTILTGITKCVNTGGWGMREFHGVQDGSWGNVPYTQYATILDHLRSYQDAGQLWVANPSEAISYIMQREAYVPDAEFTTEGIEVSWNESSYDMTGRLGPKLFTSPITLELDLSSESGEYVVSQGYELITDSRMIGSRLETNVYPDQGSLLLTDTTQCSICLIRQPVNQTGDEGASVTFNVLAVGQNLSYQWYVEPGVEIPDGDSSALTINDLTSEDIGAYYVEITKGGELETSLSANLSVNATSGVGELQTHDLYSIYPNPAKDIVQLSSVNNEAFSLDFLTLAGEVVFSQKDMVANYLVDLSKFKTGMYIVRLTTETSVHLTNIIVE